MAVLCRRQDFFFFWGGGGYLNNILSVLLDTFIIIVYRVLPANLQYFYQSGIAFCVITHGREFKCTLGQNVVG